MPVRLRPAVLLLAACTTGTAPRSATLRDSAGIQIVDNPHPASPVYRVIDPVPVLDLGGRDVETEMFNEYLDVRILADGGVLVSDRGTSRIQVFDSRGMHVRTVGRAGEGPGEFRAVSGMFLLPGDTLLTWDTSLRRLTWFDPQGTLLGLARIEPPDGEGFPFVFGRLDDGQVAGLSMMGLVGAQEGSRSIAPVWVADTAGTSTRIGSFPSIEFMSKPLGDGLHVAAAPFSRMLMASVVADLVATSTMEAYEVKFWKPGQGLVRVVRRAGQPRRQTPEDLEAYIEAMTDPTRTPTEMADQLATLLREAPRREFMPPHGRILGTTDASMWVEEYRYEGEELAPVFSVFDSSGIWLGDVTFPQHFRLLHVRGERAAGRLLDRDGVPHAVVYRLRPPP